MIRAILFDMDGLIFDTESIHKACWQAAAKKQNITIDEAFYQTFIGVQTPECEKKLLEKFSPQFDLERFRSDRDTLLEKSRQKQAEFKPGFQQLMYTLKQLDLSCALVTSSTLTEVKHHFSANRYLEEFDAIVTAEDVARGKPNPDCYLLACQKLDIKARHCLVLEDSNNGMRAGLEAGCLAAMVPDLLQPGEDVARRANFIYDSLHDVIKLIEATCTSPDCNGELSRAGA